MWGGFLLQDEEHSSCIQLALKPPLFLIKHCLSILFYLSYKLSGDIFFVRKSRNVTYAPRLNIIKNSTNFNDRSLKWCTLSTFLTSEKM